MSECTYLVHSNNNKKHIIVPTHNAPHSSRRSIPINKEKKKSFDKMSAEDYTILFSCWHSTPECRSRELINSFIVKLLLHCNEIIPCIYYNDLLAVAPALLRFLVTRIRFVCSQITYRHMHTRMFWFLMIISLHQEHIIHS